MPRLPKLGGDIGHWGSILNDFLSQSHTSTGGLKPNSVGSSQIQSQSVTKAQLDKAVQASLDKADSALQSQTAAGSSSNSSNGGGAVIDESNLIHKTGNETIGGIKTFTSVPVVPAGSLPQTAITDLTSDLAGKEPLLAASSSSTYLRGDKSWQTLNKAAVGGLENVDNTSDANKPVSTAQAAADALKQPIASLEADVAAKIGTSGALDTALDGEYTAAFRPSSSILYDGSGNISSVTEGGITTTYTYNSDGTVATENRLGLVRTWTYDGNYNPISSVVA